MRLLLDVHTGDFLALFRLEDDEGFYDEDGDWQWYNFEAFIKAPYCLAFCILLLLMATTGFVQWQTPQLVRKNRNKVRRWHHATSYVAMAWIVLMATTGQSWATVRWWLGDATGEGDMILLMKQLHVGYFSLFGLTNRLETMKWWSILGGAVLGLCLALTGVYLSYSQNIVPWLRAQCGLCPKRKKRKKD